MASTLMTVTDISRGVMAVVLIRHSTLADLGISAQSCSAVRIWDSDSDVQIDCQTRVAGGGRLCDVGHPLQTSATITDDCSGCL